MDNIFDQHASSDIIFYLDDFEGPIELLVHLCRASGLDVHDVKISSITDQYFKYIENIDSVNMDMDKVSDFLVMAATLLEIKAKAALPKEDDELAEEEEEIDAEEELRRRMIEYSMFKEKAEDIKQQETLYRYYREPQYTDSDTRVILKNFNLDKLMEAYAYLFYRFNHIEEEVNVKTIEKDTFTVKDKLSSLVETLIRDKEVKFFNLFDESYNKNEVITTFMALLELVGKQFAHVSQDDNTMEIYISINSECDPETYDYSQLDLSYDKDEIEETTNG